MSIERFYPYRIAPDEIALSMEVEGASGDIQPRDYLDCTELHFERLTIRLSMVVPLDVIRKVIAPNELDHPPVDVRVVYRSLTSRKRGALLVEGDNCVYQGVIDIDPRDWRGELEVQAILYRTSSNAELPPGYGADVGSVLAWSEPSRILFDKPLQPPGSSLNIVWLDFVEHQRLEPHKEHLFALDIQGDIPTLFMNEGVDRAKLVLENEAKHGRAARVRDATHFLIIHQVWTSLLTSALLDLADTAHTGEVDLDEMAEGWRPTVLKQWASWLFPEEGKMALEALKAAVADNGGIDMVLDRLPTAIQGRFKTFRAFHGLVKELVTLQ